MTKLVVFALSGIIVVACLSSCSGSQSNTTRSEAEIRDLLARWEKGFLARDIDAVMSVYAPGDAVVAYDVGPPLQYKGKEAYRKSYEAFFAAYQGPLELEMRDARVVVSGDVAFIHSLEHISGTLKGGQKSAVWLRETSGLRKLEGNWFLVHDHLSAPVDFEKTSALLDLTP
jgi:uncharacterized protein (TIGR02246 family)